MRDSLRLALGTLTILPVRPPRRIDGRTAGVAMLLAPGIGAALGGLAGLVGAWVLVLHGTPLLAGLAGVATLAWATRGMHLDGLADTADGLGSARRGAAALAVMKRSDIGPFGVVTLVLALGVQASALAGIAGQGLLMVGRLDIRGGWALVLALLVVGAASRAALPLATRSGLPAARADGLGATVAGTVSHGTLIAVGLALALSVLAGSPGPLLGIAAAELLLRRARARFGGITGDVLGAAVEVTSTVTLVVLALSV